MGQILIIVYNVQMKAYQKEIYRKISVHVNKVIMIFKIISYANVKFIYLGIECDSRCMSCDGGMKTNCLKCFEYHYRESQYN